MYMLFHINNPYSDTVSVSQNVQIAYFFFFFLHVGTDKYKIDAHDENQKDQKLDVDKSPCHFH